MENINDLINQQNEPIQITDSVIDLENIFLDYEYTHYPILEDTIFIGSFSKEDAEFFNTNEKLHEYKHQLCRFYVRKNMNWFDVFEEFAKNNSNILPVLDENNNYIGFYELDEVLYFLNETPFLKESGSILVVEKNSTSFSISQICQIIESNNAKILGVFISNIENNNVQATIKMSTININEIIQTFRRYEYDIVSDHQEDTYLNNLKERSDYLDKYLNI